MDAYLIEYRSRIFVDDPCRSGYQTTIHQAILIRNSLFIVMAVEAWPKWDFLILRGRDKMGVFQFMPPQSNAKLPKKKFKIIRTFILEDDLGEALTQCAIWLPRIEHVQKQCAEIFKSASVIQSKEQKLSQRLHQYRLSHCSTS